MNKTILTLPMMPVDGNNFGKFVTPIVCETLSKIYNGTYYHCVNLLDSFNDRTLLLDKYISSLNENNINYDKLWYDNTNIDLLLDNIQKLINNGYINELNSTIYRCDCGIVEIEENKISSCNQQNLKFEYKSGKMICKSCGGICKKNNEKILAFTPKKIKRQDIIFLPSYLNNDAKTYDRTIINSYTTISRIRDTGVKINYNGTYYNIDIDFLWATYLTLFDEKEKIVVSGNKMLYQLFLVGLLEKCLQPENKTILLGTPYLTNIKDIVNNPNFIQDKYFQKLAVIFNLKWNKKEKDYDQTILKYLKGLYYQKRIDLYNIATQESICIDNFVLNTDNILQKQMNMQECIKKLKRR